MLQIQVDKKYPAFVTFDGTVLEYFSEDNDTGRRFHVGLITSIEVTADKKGVHHLKMSTKKSVLSKDLDQSIVDQVRKMVSAVQQAMADGQ